jgi:hypothetical protein
VVVDLSILEVEGLFDGPNFKGLGEKKVFGTGSLNAFIELGKPFWSEARATLQDLFAKGNSRV